jgi:hypothetical protein
MDEHLDVVAVTLLCGLALNEDVMTRLKKRGHGDLRFSHGFVVQHLAQGPVAVARRSRTPASREPSWRSCSPNAWAPAA